MRRIGGAFVATLGLVPAALPGSAAASSGCAALAAHRTLPAITSYDPRRGAPRFFAMQFKQDVRYVSSYGSFRAKIECMLRQYVLPRLARHRPNVVVFDEDVGLATLATGSRGALARNLFARPGGLSCESEGVPCTTLAALATITATYAVPLAAYHLRLPLFAGLDQAFVAATDTTVRSFMGTFSTLAKRYHLYMIGSTDVPPFTQSRYPEDLALFSDPDLKPRPSSVYVATAPQVYDEAFMWGPRDVRSSGPDVLRNVVASNLKLPLTSLELEIGFAPGPATGPAAVANLRPYRLPGTRARLGFATSLPAFIYGNPAPGVDPCSNTSLYYMRCLDKLGANVVIQDDANPGRWAGFNGASRWQPLDWMTGVYRAVSDPTVRFDYNVNPMMVGNLADLVFDGQSAITQRGLRGSGCLFIGDRAFVPGQDPSVLAPDVGPKPEFLALAPWVVPDGPRGQLEHIGAELAPGSHSPLENDYLETALVADLPVPPDPGRGDCAGVG